MERDLNHLREQAERVRWCARFDTDPKERQRLEAVARDCEKMAQTAKFEDAESRIG